MLKHNFVTKDNNQSINEKLCGEDKVDRSECCFCVSPGNAISGGMTAGLITSQKF